MNKDEAKQHVRDTRTVEKAISDCDHGKFNPPLTFMDEMALMGGLAVSDRERHDDNVYRAAYREAKK